MKSIGLALLMAAADREHVDRRTGLLEDADAIDVHAARNDDLHVRMPRQVEPRADLLHELGRDAAPLGRRVEPDAPQAVAERLGHAERLLRLVLEGVDQDDAGHLGIDVAVEGLGGADGVAEDEDQGVGHGPGRREAGEARPGRRGGADAAAHHRGVVHLVGDARMHVARAEADDRDRRRGVDDATGGARPAGAGREDAEDRGLVQAEGGVARLDAHDDLLRPESIAVVQRLDHRRVGAVHLAEDLAQVGVCLLGAAQDAFAAREDLHRDHRVELLGGEDRPRALEIDVGRLAGQDVGGSREARRRALGGHGRAVYDARRRRKSTASGHEDQHDQDRAHEANDARRTPRRGQDALRLGDGLHRAAQVAVGEPPVRELEALRRDRGRR